MSLKCYSHIRFSIKSINFPGGEKALTSLEIAAQAFFFFLAGFETSASTASYVFYELARNPDIQKKLVSEIDRTLKENDGKITYDGVLSINYLTQVINGK